MHDVLSALMFVLVGAVGDLLPWSTLHSLFIVDKNKFATRNVDSL